MLAARDITVERDHANTVVLRSADLGSIRLPLVITNRPPRTSEPLPMDVPGLLVAPHLSSAQRARLAAAHWSYVATDGAIHVNFEHGEFDAPTEPQRPRRPTEPLFALAKSRIIHALLEDLSQTQTAVAQAAGVTQPYVHNVIRELRALGYTFAPADAEEERSRLLSLWLVRRRWQPITTYWTGATDLAAIVDICNSWLPGNWLLSGDIAADILAPWARPTTVTAITSAGSVLSSNLVQVTKREEAQLIVHDTDDPLVFQRSRDATWNQRKVSTANRFQVAWDLSNSHAVDRDAAFDRFMERIDKF